MELVNIAIGSVVIDLADSAAERDVLYLERRRAHAPRAGVHTSAEVLAPALLAS